MIAPPAKVLLQLWRTCGPDTVKSQSTLVSAVSRGGGVATGKARITHPAFEVAAEATAGSKEEILIPIARRRQFQLELVLWSSVAHYIAILTDVSCDRSAHFSKAASRYRPRFQPARWYINKPRRSNY